MKDKLIAAGLQPSQTGRKSNPRCICCNMPSGKCKWIAQDAHEALAKRQSTWSKPVAARGGK